MLHSSDPVLTSSIADRTVRIGARVTLMLGVSLVLSTLGMVILTSGPLPFGDQWDNLVSGRSVTWEWLTSQHNEHRLLFPRLIFLADHVLSRESNVVDLLVNILVQSATAALFVRLAKGLGLAQAFEVQWTIGIVLACLFSAVQYENFTWGFQVQFFGICLVATATFMVLVLAPPALPSLFAVVLLEAVGVYTLSSGMIIVVLSVPLAHWLRRPVLHVGILATTGAALLGSYLIGYGTPVIHADPFEALLHLDRVAIYALTELGNPLWALLFLRSARAATLLGAAGLALFFLFGWRLSRTRERAVPSELVLFSIAAFVVATTVLTGLGRWTFGTDQALSSRYATPSFLFWLALLLVTAAHARRFAQKLQYRVMSMGLVLLLLLGLSQPRFIIRAARVDLDRKAAGPAILAGVDDAEMLQRLHASEDTIFDGREALKQDHASVFAASWADWLGRPLAAGRSARTVPPCSGRYDLALLLSDPDHPGWRAEGILDPGTTGKLSDRIVFVDDESRVVGYGLSRLTGHALAKNPSEADRANYWIGEFGNIDPAEVTAYALRTDDIPACSLGKAKAIRR